MNRSTIMLLAGAFSAAATLGLALPACVGEGSSKAFACPSEEVFTGLWPDGGPAGASVSEYMSRRCGTLDCHGSELRPMRLYGQYGLRDPDEDNVSGGKPTTPAELEANYATVCSQEPEKTAKAVEDVGQSAEKLLVVQKARGAEGHKGGAVVKQNSPGDQCIAGWLRGDDPEAVAAACQTAIDGL